MTRAQYQTQTRTELADDERHGADDERTIPRVLLPSNDLGEASLARTRNSSRKLRRGWRPSPLQKTPVITEDAHTRTQTLRSLGWRETQWSASFFQDIREGRNNEKRGNRPPASRTPTKRLLFFFFHVDHAMPSSKAASTRLGAGGPCKNRRRKRKSMSATILSLSCSTSVTQEEVSRRQGNETMCPKGHFVLSPPNNDKAGSRTKPALPRRPRRLSHTFFGCSNFARTS